MSLRGDKYETAEEVRMRLEGTVVLYDGKPVYITRTSLRAGADEEGNEHDRVWFRPLPYNNTEAEIRKLLSSRHFDLTPFKMGYMNHKGSAVFVERLASRQSKQGLCENNCKTVDFATDRRVLNFAQLISSKGFVDMINGVYPSMEEAREMFRKRAGSVAISRRFCLVNDEDLDLMYVSHKGMKCGTISPGQGVRLATKHRYLRESFVEDRIDVI